MTLQKRLFNEFIFGNFFIALCAASMVFTTFLMIGLPIFITPFTIFLTLATFLLYNFHRISFKIDYSDKQAFLFSLNKIQLSKIEKAEYITASAMLFISIFYLNIRVFPYLIPLAAIAAAYSIPVIGTKNKRKRLLEVYLIKTPVLALVWALVTTIIPLEEQNISIYTTFVFLQFVSRTLFIFALCIPFEIRDMAVDKKNNVMTLAVVLGKKKMIIIGFILIVLEIIVHHFMQSISTYAILSLDISSLLALLLIFLQDKKAGPFYYKFFVDGTMIARFILLFTAIYLI